MNNNEQNNYILDLLSINKNKIGILNKMLELELDGKKDSQDYVNFVNLYKRVNSSLTEKINTFNYDKETMVHDIFRYDSRLAKEVSLGEIISSDEVKLLSLKKSMTDFGLPFLELYAKSNVVKYDDINIESENEVNANLINHYMVSDFTNLLFYEIQECIRSNELSLENKKELLKYKYNLIFLVPNLEIAAIKSNFEMFEEPKVANKQSIINAGMNYDDYTSYLDNALYEKLSFTVYKALFDAIKYDIYISPIDILIVRACALKINNIELLNKLDVGQTDIEGVCSDVANIIINVIEECKSVKAASYK